ncbi:MAG: tetratricopeptide repeat protein [Bacteroidia bacterium]
MRKFILVITVIALSISAYAHRAEINILDTEAGKASALAKVGGETGRYINKEKGLEILAKALSEVYNVENLHYREIVLAAIANEYAGLDETTKAINITRSLNDVHLYVTNLGKIANKLVKTNPELAEKLLNEAVEKARKKADEHDFPALLAELSGKYIRLNKTEVVKGLLKEANTAVEKIKEIHLDDKLSLYAEIAANMVAAGQKDEAFKIFDKAYELSKNLEDPFERAAILAMLGGELAEKGQPEKALLMLEEALKVCAMIKDEQKRGDVTSEVARNFSQSKKCERAVEIAKSINDIYFASEALIVTAKNSQKIKQQEAALRILKDLSKSAENIENKNKKAIILAKTAAELAELGKKEDAQNLLEKAFKTLS